MMLTPVQQETLDLLRGDPEDRPVVDHTLRAALKAEFDLATANIEGRVTIDKHRLNKIHQCEGLYIAPSDFEWRPANAKGTVAHKAIELSIGGVKPKTPHALVDLACERICEDPQHGSLADYIRDIDDGERAELRNGTADVLIGFLEMFPPMQPHWRPHAEATTAAVSTSKNVVCRGKIDLKLGQINGERANSMIIDMKTGNPSFSDLDDLRFYALLETMRTGSPPFQWANAYLGAGRLEVERYSESIMWTTLRRLIDGIEKIARIELDKKLPVLTPGRGCTFCSSKPSCNEANAYELDQVSQF